MRFVELEIPVGLVVVPEAEQDQAGLVLLDRVLRVAGLVDPRVPAAARLAGGRVLVAEVTFLGEQPGAEGEELARHFHVSRLVHRVGDHRAVPRPHIAIGVARELDDLRVVGGNDCAAVVDLGPQDQQAPPVELGNAWGQFRELVRVLAHPGDPVVTCTLDEGLGGTLHHDLRQRLDRLEILGRDQPLVDGADLARRYLAGMETEGHVDRALLDRIAPELAVFRIPPGSLGSAHILLSAGVGIDPYPLSHLADRGEIAMPLVGNQTLYRRIEHGGVAHLSPVEAPIEVEEQPDLAG